jgi:hypothetical protein
MVEQWDYRHELINFQRNSDGSISYSTKSEGEVELKDSPLCGRLKLDAWATARKEAEKTGKDVVVYVKGNQIISRTRSVSSSSFN